MKRIYSLLLIIYSLFFNLSSSVLSQSPTTTFRSTSQRKLTKTLTRTYISLSSNITLMTDNKTDNILLIKDYLNSTRVILTEKGTIDTTVSYYPYGTIRLTSLLPTKSGFEGQAQVTDKFFTGHRQLTDLSLIHAQARFYSPTLGTFIQPDTVEGPNRYGYVYSNPITYNDPTGTAGRSGFMGEIGQKITQWLRGRGLRSLSQKSSHYENRNASRIIVEKMSGDLMATNVSEVVAPGSSLGLIVSSFKSYHSIRAYDIPESGTQLLDPLANVINNSPVTHVTVYHGSYKKRDTLEKISDVGFQSSSYEWLSDDLPTIAGKYLQIADKEKGEYGLIFELIIPKDRLILEYTVTPAEIPHFGTLPGFSTAERMYTFSTRGHIPKDLVNRVFYMNNGSLDVLGESFDEAISKLR